MTLTAFRRVLAREYDNRHGCFPPSDHPVWWREPWVRPFLEGITPVVTARTDTRPSQVLAVTTGGAA